MNTLDIIILLPLIYGLIRGLFRGLIGELTAIIAIVAAIICAKLYAPQAATLLTQQLSLDPSVCQALAYILIFFVVALVLQLLGKILQKLLSAISLGWLNRLLGAIFGTLKWALIVSVIINGIALLDDSFHFIQPELKQNSLTYEPAKRIASVTWDTVQTINLQPTEQ